MKMMEGEKQTLNFIIKILQQSCCDEEVCVCVRATICNCLERVLLMHEI